MKPALDTIIFTSQLSRSLGFRGTALLFINYYATARILRAATPAFGKLAVVERGLEGEFRTGMGRVGRESEEIACVFSSFLRCVRIGAKNVLGFTEVDPVNERFCGTRICV